MKHDIGKTYKSIKWTRKPFFRIETTINNKTVTIGRDSGSFGTKNYYFVEVENKVIMHGFSTQKEAKTFVSTKHKLKDHYLFETYLENYRRA